MAETTQGAAPSQQTEQAAEPQAAETQTTEPQTVQAEPAQPTGGGVTMAGEQTRRESASQVEPGSGPLAPSVGVGRSVRTRRSGSLPPSDAEGTPLTTYTVNELQELAADMGLEGYHSLRKAELIQAIDEAQ